MISVSVRSFAAEVYAIHMHIWRFSLQQTPSSLMKASSSFTYKVWLALEYNNVLPTWNMDVDI